MVFFPHPLFKTQTPVSNSGCGSSQLCAAEPQGCNPAEAGSCFFASTRQLGGQNFEFGISGDSEGYIGVALSPDATLVRGRNYQAHKRSDFKTRHTFAPIANLVVCLSVGSHHRVAMTTLTFAPMSTGPSCSLVLYLTTGV